MPSFEELVGALQRAMALTGPWAPVLLFGAAFIEHLFPPFPGDLLVVLGAWYAVEGQLSWPVVYVAVTTGSVVGAWVDHRIGAWLGRRLERDPRAGRWLKPEQLARFEAAYRRWGAWLLVLNRFFPGVRGVIFLAAGASGIPLSRTLLLGGLSAAAWNGLLLAAGGLLASNLDELVALVERYNRVAWLVMAVALLALLVRSLASRRRRGR